MFDGAQKPVTVGELRCLPGPQHSLFRQRPQRVQRPARAHLRYTPAVQQLQELGDELDVADAAKTRLYVAEGLVAVVCALLDPAFLLFQRVNLLDGQVLAVDPPLKVLQQFLAQLKVAGAGARLDQRLALPGRAEAEVVLQGRFQAAGQAAALTLRPQARIDAKDVSVLGALVEQGYQRLGQPRRVLLTCERA